MVTFTEEILNAKLHFLCSGFSYYNHICNILATQTVVIFRAVPYNANEGFELFLFIQIQSVRGHSFNRNIFVFLHCSTITVTKTRNRYPWESRGLWWYTFLFTLKRFYRESAVVHMSNYSLKVTLLHLSCNYLQIYPISILVIEFHTYMNLGNVNNWRYWYFML